MTERIYFIHPPRDDFAATMTADEKTVWAEHFERLQRLLASGQLILAGPTLGTVNTGLVIFEAPTSRPRGRSWRRIRWFLAATHSGKSARSGYRCCADETDLHQTLI